MPLINQFTNNGDIWCRLKLKCASDINLPKSEEATVFFCFAQRCLVIIINIILGGLYLTPYICIILSI